MKKFINNPELVKQLSWLILPLVFAWLATNYLWYSIRGQRPVWEAQGEGLSVETEEVAPYLREFEKVNNLGSEGLVTFWFDDAWKSQYLIGHEVLKKYGFTGAVAVPTDMVGYPAYMDWRQIRDLQENGWEITNHSASHADDFNNWKFEDVYKDFSKSQKILWKQRVTSDHFVAPLGRVSEGTRKAAEMRFKSLRTVDWGVNKLPLTDPYNILAVNLDHKVTADDIKPYLDEAKKNRGWLIITFHQLGKGDEGGVDVLYPYKYSENDMDEIVRAVKDSGLRVVVPSQII